MTNYIFIISWPLCDEVFLHSSCIITHSIC